MRKAYIRPHHLIIQGLSILAMLISFIYAMVIALTVKGEVSTHVNVVGEIDGYGSPATILLLPSIMIVMLVVMLLVLHKTSPKSWNMPFRVSEERQIIVYSDMSLMMSLICLESGIFTLIETLTYINNIVSGFAIAMIYTAALLITVLVITIAAARHNKGLA